MEKVILLTWWRAAVAVVAAMYVSSASAHRGEATEAALVHVEPQVEDNFSLAVFQCWLPSKHDTIKGVLCVVLDSPATTPSLLNDSTQWRLLCESLGYALLSCSFTNRDIVGNEWDTASEGSGRALKEALGTLATMTGVSALSKAPLVICGVCKAGQFAMSFGCFDNERVRGVVSIGGGKHQLDGVSAADKIPSLLVAATDRSAAAQDNIRTLFEEGRRRGASWTLAYEPIGLYDEGRCSTRVGEYLDTLLSDVGKEQARHLHRRDKLSFVPRGLPLKLEIEPLCDIAQLTLFPETSETAKFYVRAEGAQDQDALILGRCGDNVRTVLTAERRGLWRVECIIDPASLPLGRFRVSLPFRIIRGRSSMVGAASVTLGGAVVGSVSVFPKYVMLRGVKPGAEISVPVKVSAASEETVEVVGAEVIGIRDCDISVGKTADNESSLNFVFRHPLGSAGKKDRVEGRRRFSGDILVKIRSKREETFRMLCFGTWAE